MWRVNCPNFDVDATIRRRRALAARTAPVSALADARWFRKQSAVRTAVSRRPSPHPRGARDLFIRLREMGSSARCARKIRARVDKLFRWLTVWAEHISLLTDLGGSLRFDPFRHPLMGLERVGEAFGERSATDIGAG
jgi:hypothetical protein